MAQLNKQIPILFAIFMMANAYLSAFEFKPLNFTLKDTKEVVSASFSPDGSKIVTTSFDKTVKVWDASNGKLIFDLAKLASGIPASFSPDSSKIVTASRDATAKVWILPPAELLKPTTLTMSVYSSEVSKYMDRKSDEKKTYEGFINFLSEPEHSPNLKKDQIQGFEELFFSNLEINMQEYLNLLIPGRAEAYREQEQKLKELKLRQLIERMGRGIKEKDILPVEEDVD